MSGIQRQVAELTNQAVVLLGGVTAQSYSVMGLNVSPLQPDSQVTGSDFVFFDSTDKNLQKFSDSSTPVLEKLSVDTLVQSVVFAAAPLSVLEEPSELSTGFAGPQNQDPELMSRFQETLLADDSTFGMAQTGVTSATQGGDEMPDSTASGSNGFSLFDFIEQAVTQAEASRQEFEDTLDGSRQGEFRELLTGSAAEAGGAARGFLQDNVAGVGRDLLSSAIDTTGLEVLDSTAEPVLSTDYYARSAEVLNGFLDDVAQPIGSISLPQVGQLISNPLDELSAYTS